jgi:hypothetical protein
MTSPYRGVHVGLQMRKLFLSGPKFHFFFLLLEFGVEQLVLLHTAPLQLPTLDTKTFLLYNQRDYKNVFVNSLCAQHPGFFCK